MSSNPCFVQRVSNDLRIVARPHECVGVRWRRFQHGLESALDPLRGQEVRGDERMSSVHRGGHEHAARAQPRLRFLSATTGCVRCSSTKFANTRSKVSGRMAVVASHRSIGRNSSR